jgi:hypothetical protein
VSYENEARYTLLTPEEVEALPEVAPRGPRGKPAGFSRDSYARHRAAFDAEVEVHKAEIKNTGGLTLAPKVTISFRCRAQVVLVDSAGRQTRDICRRPRGHDDSGGGCSPKWRHR